MNRRRRARKGLIRSVLAVLLLIAAAVGLYGVYKDYRYPLAYQQIMEKWAEDYDVPKDLAAAVICAESRFDATARSNKGALGLMQLQPETAAWAAEKLDLPAPTGEELLDPAVNIRLGIWYLSYLLERFEGSEMLALAAYNAGPNRVREWMNDHTIRDGEPKTIPYQETRDYVIKIEETRAIYRERYGLGA